MQDLFHWSEDFTNYLNNRNPKGFSASKDKNHRLACYFFESIVQTFLSPLDNVLVNPECEFFI